jgi:hypothetical protein
MIARGRSKNFRPLRIEYPPVSANQLAALDPHQRH